MRRTITAILFGPLALSGAVGCQPGTQGRSTGADEGPRSNWCSQTVDSMKALTAQLSFPEYLVHGGPKRGGEFDVNEFFSVLRHLTMEPGFVLDYVYAASGTGGRPVLYARPASDSPYQASNYPYADGYFTYFEVPSARFLAHVITDGTPQGLFELTLLYLLGDQFYLSWHGNYHDETVICGEAELLKILAGQRFNDGAKLESLFGEEELARIRSTGLRPRIRVEGDRASVRFVYFTNWGGFFETKFTLNAVAPHSIIDRQTENLARYFCGILF